jgi:uncharacterized protein (DUF427 family)
MSSRPVEDVWDYPRPPSIEPSDEHLVVTLGGMRIVDTTTSYRIRETSHPPTYYLPIAAFADGVLVPIDGTTFCEWKGAASYFDVVQAQEGDFYGGWITSRVTGPFKGAPGTMSW